MKITINNPEWPKGAEFHVNDLGTLENGKTVEVSDEQLKLFETIQGRSIKEAFKENVYISLGGTERGGDD